MFTESHFFSHDAAADKPRERLRRHNLTWELTWEQPTKTFQTRKVRSWLGALALSEIDRLEMDQLCAQWDLWEQQLERLEERIKQRFQQNESARRLSLAPGVGAYSGLVIGCRNSGAATDRLDTRKLNKQP